MSISEYILKIESVINSFVIVSSFNLNIDRKTTDIAFISGSVEFRNGAILDFKEFIENAETGIEKYKYAYNYRSSSEFLFRYDNAPDPSAKGIKTFPHHKHLKDRSIIEAKPAELSGVLKEIERIYIEEIESD
ncbi:MAG: hypothetical protein HY756_04935 [Nitrospirae bacterium]|nr:hypothetical protein [Nitrospirota bacterium]